jgi:hypothetical protein
MEVKDRSHEHPICSDEGSVTAGCADFDRYVALRDYYAGPE